MTVTPLPSLAGFTPDALDDAPVQASPVRGGVLDFGGLVDAYRTAAATLQRASTAEADFSNGSGDLASMIFERSRADAALGVASALSSKAVAAINSFANMQL